MDVDRCLGDSPGDSGDCGGLPRDQRDRPEGNAQAVVQLESELFLQLVHRESMDVAGSPLLLLTALAF